jgi:hypothetical protein
MYAYEGVSFCLGTCGHVHNFAAAAARLFLLREKGCDYDHVGADPPNKLEFCNQQERRK